jgi:hypothetical protein
MDQKYPPGGPPPSYGLTNVQPMVVQSMSPPPQVLTGNFSDSDIIK